MAPVAPQMDYSCIKRSDELELPSVNSAEKNLHFRKVVRVLNNTPFASTASQECLLVFKYAQDIAHGRELCELGVCEGLVRTVIKFGNNPEASRHANMAISALACDSKNWNALRQASACLASVLTLLKAFDKGDTTGTRSAIETARCLAEDEQNAKELGENGLCEKLVEVFQKLGKSNQEIAAQITETAWNLSVVPENCARFHKLNAGEIFANTFKAFNVCSPDIPLYGRRAQDQLFEAVPRFQGEARLHIEYPVATQVSTINANNTDTGNIPMHVSRYMAAIALSRLDMDVSVLTYLRATFGDMLDEEDLASTRFGTINANVSPYGRRACDMVANAFTRFSVDMNTGLPRCGLRAPIKLSESRFSAGADSGESSRAEAFAVSKNKGLPSSGTVSSSAYANIAKLALDIANLAINTGQQEPDPTGTHYAAYDAIIKALLRHVESTGIYRDLDLVCRVTAKAGAHQILTNQAHPTKMLS